MDARKSRSPLPPELAVTPLLAAVRTPKTDRRKCKATRKQIVTTNRFISTDGQQVTQEAAKFGAAMTAYLGSRNKVGWTGGEVCDVLLSLGYRNTTVKIDGKIKRAERNFEINVHRMTTAIERMKNGSGLSKRNRRPFPTWSEVLALAARLGWRLPV